MADQDPIPTLHYVDRRFEGVDRRFEDLDKRLDQQRDDLQARLGAMNEIRESMRDQAGLFITRREFWAVVSALVTLVGALLTHMILRG